MTPEASTPAWRKAGSNVPSQTPHLLISYTNGTTGTPLMSDAEIIATFMEPKPTGSWIRDAQPTWWYFSTHEPPTGWHIKPLTLDALHEVEAKLTDEQWRVYINRLLIWRSTLPKLYAEQFRALIHASAEQKIAALAAVLRPVVEGK